MANLKIDGVGDEVVARIGEARLRAILNLSGQHRVIDGRGRYRHADGREAVYSTAQHATHAAKGYVLIEVLDTAGV